MKPTTAITVIVIVLVGAFMLYEGTLSEIEEEAPRAQANISESLVSEPSNTKSQPERPNVQINAFEGLGEEFDTFLREEGELREDFERVEPQKEATTTAGN
ncbi:MAG: hypothetical protein WD883_01440 [Candidatus Colwellbacteria bacterium]